METNEYLDELNAHIAQMAAAEGLHASAHVVDKKASDINSAGPHLEIAVTNLRAKAPLNSIKTVTLSHFAAAGAAGVTMFDEFVRGSIRELAGK